MLALLCAPLVLLALSGEALAQDQAFLRGLSLESEERYRDAAEAYREALRANPASVPAVLGLERVYASLGITDSILPVLDRAIAVAPRVSALRSAQLRSLRSVGQPERAQEAFERWVRAAPRDPAPYREFARLLLQHNQTDAADSVLQRAQAALGRNNELEVELAQLRAAMGLWVLAAQSWRRAVAAIPHYEQAALFSLMSTPPERRDSVRALLAATPLLTGPLRVAAALELSWGSAEDGWRLLSPLPPDSAGVAAWRGFADRAEEAHAWLVARDALVAVARVEPSSETLARAAAAALGGGDAASAASLGQRVLASGEAEAVAEVLPLMIRALGMMGRANEAQRLYDAHHRKVRDDQRPELTRQLAWAWVRAGDTGRARELLGRDTAPGEVEAWLALYDGDLAGARAGLTRSGVESSHQLLIAVSLLTRTGAASSPAAGRAFLALARGDTAGAASAFEVAARELPDAGSLMLLHSARLAAVRDVSRALPLWRRIAEEHADSPEGPEAILEWARALRRSGEHATAVERFEHLILTYPRSALVPQARRELEQARTALRGSEGG